MKHRVRRLLSTVFCAAGLAMAVPAGAAATPPTIVVNNTPARATGMIVSLDWSSFTIQTSGRRMSTLSALRHAADAITKGAYPYVYGGGHEQAGMASIGIKGPGYDGRRIGYDCSGAVGAVLAAAGLWTPGTGVPADNGVIAQLRRERLIGLGPGTVMLYDRPTVHIFMNIEGRYFGTSDGGAGSFLNPHGGAGWLDDGASDAASHAFRRYHLSASALQLSTVYGPTLTFRSDAGLVGDLEAGDRVRVTYLQPGNGTLVAESIG
jgi:hypothetical protein